MSLFSGFWSFEIEPLLASDPSGLILAHPDSRNLYILNESAGFLWSAMEQLPAGSPTSQIVQPFADRFGISAQQAEADIDATLESWSHSFYCKANASESAPSPLDPIPPPLSEPLFSLDFTLGASSFRLIVHDSEFVDEILPRLAHLSAPSPSAPPDYVFKVFRSASDNALRVSRDHVLLPGASSEVPVARVLLLEEIARLVHDPHSDWLGVLHAAAVAHPESREAVILAAATNSGKSTLTAALLHAGFDLLSDDSAAVTTGGQLLALPFALMLRAGSWPVLEPYFPELAKMPVHHRYGDPVRFLTPPTISTKAGIPKALIFVNYAPAAETQLQPISHLHAFYLLQQSGFWIPHTRPAIAAFIEWVQSLPVYELSYSRLSTALPVIQNLLRAR